MIIREANYGEFEIVRMVMFEAFKEYIDILHPPSGALRETEETIRTKTEGRGGSLLVWDGAKAVGTAVYYCEEDYMYIGRLSVLPSHRGRGIGKMMMAYLENQAREQGCTSTRIEVRTSLPDNITLYKRQDYQPIEEHRYPDNSDGWYIMSKVL